MTPANNVPTARTRAYHALVAIAAVGAVFVHLERAALGDQVAPRTLDHEESAALHHDPDTQQSADSSAEDGLAPALIDVPITRVSLPGGARLVIVPDHRQPVVALHARWLGGRHLARAEQDGASQIVAELLRARCGRARSDHRQGFAFEAGPTPAPVPNLAVSASRDAISARAAWPAAHASTGLAAWAQCVFNNDGADGRTGYHGDSDLAIARAKRRVGALRRQRAEVPSALVQRALMAALYGSAHPYGRPGTGTAASVAALSAPALRQFASRVLSPDRLTIAVVGAIEPEHVAQVLGAYLVPTGGRRVTVAPASVPVVPAVPARIQARELYLDHPAPGRGDAAVAIGFVGTTGRDPEHVMFELLGEILVGPAGTGRLVRGLRGQRGLAHAVAVEIDAGLGPGYFAVRWACAQHNLAATVHVARTELARIGFAPVSEAELSAAKRRLIGRYTRIWSRPAGLAAVLASAPPPGSASAPANASASASPPGSASASGGAPAPTPPAASPGSRGAAPAGAAQSTGALQRARIDAVNAVSASELQAAARVYLDWRAAVTVTVAPPALSPEAARRSRGVRRRLPVRELRQQQRRRTPPDRAERGGRR